MELTRTQMIEQALKASAPMSLPEILEEEIKTWRASEQYREMVDAEQYYRNRSDVQNKTNEIAKRSNVKMEHSYYRKLIRQKANYLLSKPWTVQSDNADYAKALGGLFDQNFRQRIKSLGAGAVKSGIAWIAPYFDDGRLRIMRLPSTEVIPLWVDAEHTRLSGYIRAYEQTVYVGRERRLAQRVEYWTTEGVQYFRNDGQGGTVLRPDTDAGESRRDHFTVGDKPYNWTAVPLAHLKYTEDELPLLRFTRELIDDNNWQKSVTADVLRDVAKFIYILRGYGGQDLAEFLADLKANLAIKVDGEHSGVDKLQADINVDAVMAFLAANRKDLYDLANAVDTKDADLGNASGTAINFRYMDLDTDCTDLAAGLQDTFLQLKPFLDASLQLSGAGDFAGQEFSIVFNTDMPVNEGDVIGNVVKSDGIISRRTQLEQHPWVTDVDEEIKRLDEDAAADAKRQQEAAGPFGQPPGNAE